jgi:cell division transport system ATP-binding protein
VFENVAFALQVIGASRSQINRQTNQVLELVGLAQKAERMPHEISGGEQQKVSIARAIVNSPPILLADEPTGNLDGRTGRNVFILGTTAEAESVTSAKTGRIEVEGEDLATLSADLRGDDLRAGPDLLR